MEHGKDNKIWQVFVVVLVLLVLLFAFSTTLDDATRTALLSEDGPVEIVSAVLYFVCCGYALIRGGGAFLKKYPYFIMIPLLFGMRELDFDKRFTTIGVLKSKFYVSPLEPWHTKLIVITLGLVVIYMLVQMLKTICWSSGQRCVQAVRLATASRWCLQCWLFLKVWMALSASVRP